MAPAKKTAKKKAAKKKAAKKKASRRKSAAAKSLAPSQVKRGLDAGEVALALDDASVSGVANEVRDAGDRGVVAGGLGEALGRHKEG